MRTRLVRTTDLRVGMAIEHLGVAHTISAIDHREPHPKIPEIDRTIRCTDGFSISGERDGWMRVPA